MGSRAERDPVLGEEGKTMCRLRLRKVDFINHGITGGFTGCQALISGTGRGHSEACCERMNEEHKGGSKRRTRRWPNTWRRCSECRDEERISKKARVSEEETTGTSSGAGRSEAPPRKFEHDVEDGSASSRWGNMASKSTRGIQERRGLKRGTEGDEAEMEVSIMERTMLEDMPRELMVVSNKCTPENEDPCRFGHGHEVLRQEHVR